MDFTYKIRWVVYRSRMPRNRILFEHAKSSIISGFRLDPLACYSPSLSISFVSDGTLYTFQKTMIIRRFAFGFRVACFCLLLLFPASASASLGDRLPEFRECISVCMWNQCMTKPITYRFRHVSMRTASVVILSSVSIVSTHKGCNSNQLSQRSTCVSSSGPVPPIATMSASISSQTVASPGTLQC